MFFFEVNSQQLSKTTHPKWLRCVVIPKDLLHVMHQGVLTVLIPSLICDHLEKKHVGCTLKELDELLAKTVFPHYKRWCRRHRQSVSTCSFRFSALRFGKDTWRSMPELSSMYKAAMTKGLMYWCASYLLEEKNQSPGGDLRYKTIYAFCRFQYLLDISGPFLSEEVTRDVAESGQRGLVLYQRLVSQDRKREDYRRAYKILPKMHSFLEMTLYIQSTRRNARFHDFKHGQPISFSV